MAPLFRILQSLRWWRSEKVLCIGAENAEPSAGIERLIDRIHVRALTIKMLKLPHVQLLGRALHSQHILSSNQIWSVQTRGVVYAAVGVRGWHVLTIELYKQDHTKGLALELMIGNSEETRIHHFTLHRIPSEKGLRSQLMISNAVE